MATEQIKPDNEINRILVVDDEPDVRATLRDYLGAHGYVVAEADSGQAMRAALEQTLPHAVLLDIGLPGEDGLTLARYLREHYNLAIIMVTGAGEVVDRIVGLEVGADDYVAKPFDLRELLARVKSVLRRYRGEPAAPAEQAGDQNRAGLRIGACVLEIESRRLLAADGSEIPLTAMEFDLLKAFAERPNRVLSRDQLLNLTCNRDWDPFDRSIDIRVARLRRKIETDPENPRVIKTVRGHGYVFVPERD
ncbi:MAG TPA: response regulator [Arenicellales bacterium]|nr:response regulator [Arenicellales bacterium]